MCEISFSDYSELWQQTPRTARKQHYCDSCRTKILPGEAYTYHFSIYEGEPTAEKLCFGCWWVQTKFGEEHGVTPCPSNITDFLRDCIMQNDDHNDPWRNDLAAIMARYRVSEPFVKYRRKKWAERHARTVQ